MKYPQKISNAIQTEVIRPKQELQSSSSAKALQIHQTQAATLEITAIKKSNSSHAGIYWIVFFCISAISAITYAVLTSKPAEPQVVKREVHKIYERVEVHNRAPASILKPAPAGNYFGRAEARSKIDLRYSILRQNLSNEHSNRIDEEYRKDINFYNSQAYLELKHYYDKKNFLLRGQKAVEMCEKVGEDCSRAEDYLSFINAKSDL